MTEIFLPFLTGLIILVAGLLFHFFPPKTINHIYGCKIPAATRSQETWDEGNSYCANLIIVAGVPTCCVGAAGMCLCQELGSAILLSAAVGVSSILCCIPLTTLHINTYFDGTGRPLKK